MDLTIVNPRKLPRLLQEDICAACHLTGASPILIRGRTITDYRPGTPLSDYRIHYRVDDGRDDMAVVGHVEQMRQSACYKKSEMTCLTCHDPHQREKPKDAVAAIRSICMNCHEKHPCSLDLAARIKKDGTDNCTACHMPRGDTDIPHIAFTHHRIGHHDKKAAGEQRRAPSLAPVESVHRLSQFDQDRNLGLAFIETASSASYAKQYGVQFRQEGKRLLDGLFSAGMRDPEAMRQLLDLEDRSTLKGPSKYATEIMKVKDAPANTRASALMSLALSDIQAADYAAAIDLLTELHVIYNTSYSLYLLGNCYVQLDRADEALMPLQKALTLRPDRPVIHEALATVYLRLGKDKLAQEHLRKAELLNRFGQK